MMRTNIVLPNIPKVSAHRGFTLMEILIAIFIFGIIVSTIFGSFHAVFSQTEAITNDSALYEMGRNCMNRMVVDLQAIHAALPPQYSEPTEDDDPDPFRFVSEIKQIDQKEFPMLRFTSRSHISFNRPPETGIAAIVYYIQQDEQNGFILRRSDDLYPFKDFEENRIDPILCNQLKSLRFAFYDNEESEYDAWDSEDENYGYATPRSVKIVLLIGDENIEHRFETLVRLPVYREKKE